MGNRAVLLELATPRGTLKVGAVLKGSFAEEALTWVDTLCFLFGLPPAEWEETSYGLAWRYQDQAGVRVYAKVTPWGQGD
jgi:hypothetical protein